MSAPCRRAYMAAGMHVSSARHALSSPAVAAHLGPIALLRPVRLYKLPDNSHFHLKQRWRCTSILQDEVMKMIYTTFILYHQNNTLTRLVIFYLN